jgi:hypothetical protein
MRSLLFVLVGVLLGCGSTETPSPHPPSPHPVEAPPATPPAVPDDFAMSGSGGPVAGWMAAGMTFTEARLQPGAARDTFELLEVQYTVDAMGARGPATESRRVTVPAARTSELHRYVVDHLAELEAPCFDPTIMDGAGSSYTVTYAGGAHTFSCVNARTPAFDGLSALYGALVSELLPAPATCASDADCRLETADGCQCIAAYTARPPGPGCSHPCFVDPCMNQVAACDTTSGSCVVRAVSAPPIPPSSATTS